MVTDQLTDMSPLIYRCEDASKNNDLPIKLYLVKISIKRFRSGRVNRKGT